MWNGISWITYLVSELEHCVGHKNGINMKLMSLTEEEPWWVLHWASLLPGWGMGAKYLFPPLNSKQMTFLNPLAQKSHIVKGIPVTGRCTMGKVRAGEHPWLHVPPRPSAASCRLHGARPRCPQPALPHCLFWTCLWAQLVCLCPKHKVLTRKPNKQSVPYFLWLRSSKRPFLETVSQVCVLST